MTYMGNNANRGGRILAELFSEKSWELDLVTK